jgi:glycosyltransferase involved in cell wall biosynthesis
VHVLYVHQHFSTPSGATGTRSYELARALLRAGHEVTMVCGSYGPGATGLEGPFVNRRREGMVDGIRVVEFDLRHANRDSLPRRAATFLRFALGSSMLALTRRHDLLFATSTPLTAAVPGIVARWLRGRDFVFEVRDLWPELPRAMGVIRNPLWIGLLSMLEWLAYRSARRCVALAPGIADGIARRGIPRSRIATIPNGCDLERFRVEPQARWRPRGVAPEDFLAVFAGTHGLANGLEAVLDGAAALKSRGRGDIRLVLVGDGMTKAGLQARAAREGLDNLLFLDPVPKARLAGLLAAADLGIQCLADVPAFYRGTSPNKFFDYLAAGLPVLNNYPGWLADEIRAHGCGWVVPPRDPTALADALEQAADDREECRARGRRAATLACSAYDRGQLAEQWVNWVVGGRRP